MNYYSTEEVKALVLKCENIGLQQYGFLCATGADAERLCGAVSGIVDLTKSIISELEEAEKNDRKKS